MFIDEIHKTDAHPAILEAALRYYLSLSADYREYFEAQWFGAPEADPPAGTRQVDRLAPVDGRGETWAGSILDLEPRAPQ